MDGTFLAALDAMIDDASAAISLGESLEALNRSRHFQVIVLDGYLNKEAVRLAHLLGAPENRSVERQDELQRQIAAVGHFAQYIKSIHSAAVLAKQSVDAAETTREELLRQDK